ncbi:pyridoxamine 5'-phosphate oxidase family protein [Spongorhabdus nitratireducens]
MMDTRLSPAELLETNHYCVLATANSEGEPWNTPLFYAFDHNWQLYWISSTDCHHSRLLAENPKASAVIYEPPGVSHETSALYLSGTAAICEGAEIEQALEFYLQRTGLGISRNADDYQGDSPCRFWKLSPEKAWTLQEPEWQDNLLLDRRTAVDIP